MILRGRKIDGQEAYRIGLVSEVVPIETIKNRAQLLGEELAAQPRKAVESMLRVVIGHATKTLDESMVDEAEAVAANRETQDSIEGMRAFMEKRKPVFNK
jgi:enoyl-CoA hydratase/carnithine racemase